VFTLERKDSPSPMIIIQKAILNSFIPDISIPPLQVHYYSEVLPTTVLILYRS